MRKTPGEPNKFRERTRGFVAGALTGILLLGITGTALAASGAINIDIYPSKLLVNNEVFRPKDVNGNDVMVFIHNGTTYAPVRALAEAYGLEVGWDAPSGTATVVDPNKVAKEDVPTSGESTGTGEANQSQFPTEENLCTITSQFVMINGNLYQLDEGLFGNGFLCYINGTHTELFFVPYTTGGRFFDFYNLFAFLTDTFQTTNNDNPFVDGAIDVVTTASNIAHKINVEREKQYSSATNFTEVYTHEYNGKMLTIPELSDGEQIVDGIRYYKEYASLKDYCDYFGINAEIKVEYNDVVGTDILVIEYASSKADGIALTGIYPKNNATNYVPKYDYCTAKFTQAIDPSKYPTAKMQNHTTGKTYVLQTQRGTTELDCLLVLFNGRLKDGCEYTVTIPANSVYGIDGSVYGEEIVYTFSTPEP